MYSQTKLFRSVARDHMGPKPVEVARTASVGEAVNSMAQAGSRVAIVTDMAVPAEQVDEAKIEEARARAEARLREKIGDEEVATVNASLARSLAQLQVKRRRRG